MEMVRDVVEKVKGKDVSYDVRGLINVRKEQGVNYRTVVIVVLLLVVVFWVNMDKGGVVREL